MDIVTFKKGDVIFRQDTRENFMYEILSGTVGIYKEFETERENKVAELSSGQFLGEMELVEGEPRSATAVALTDSVQLKRITDDHYLDFFEQNPVQVYLIMKQLSENLRQTTRNYTEACRTLDETLRVIENGEQPSARLLEQQKRFRSDYSSDDGYRFCQKKQDHIPFQEMWSCFCGIVDPLSITQTFLPPVSGCR